MRGRLRKIFIAVVVLAGLGLLAYHSRHRIHLADFTWSKFRFAVSQANPWLLILAAIAVYGCYAIRAQRWRQFCLSLGETRFMDVFTGTIMGFAAIFILGRAGEPVRPLLLARKTSLPVANMFGIWVLERLFDFAAAVLLATLSLLVFAKQLSDAGVNTDWVERARASGILLLGMLAALILLMVYFRLHGAGILSRRLEYWRHAGGWRTWIATTVAGLSEGLGCIRTLSDLFWTSFYTILHWGLVALAYLWVAQAFQDAFPHSEINYPGAMLLLAVTLVGSVVQLPGIGGGAQIASAVALTTIFGVEQESAAAIAVMLWVVTFAISILVGIPLLIHEGLSIGDLRKLVRAEVQAEEAGEHVAISTVSLADHRGKKPAGSSP